MGAIKSIATTYSANQYLFWYIEQQNQEKICSMLDQKPELIQCDLTVNYKTTPLHRAALNGNLDIARLLLQNYRADINFKTTAGETPLMAAAKRDKLEMLNYLLSKEANADIISPTGLTALDYAILQGNYECALQLHSKVKLTRPKNPFQYFNIAHKYKYRWVDYQILLDGLLKAIPLHNLPDFLTKPKKKFNDPVVDPRETWKNWFLRNLEFRDPPLVERTELAEDMQPQNRNFAGLRQMVTRMTMSPLSQQPALYPRVIDQVQSEIKMNEGHSEVTQKIEVRSAN